MFSISLSIPASERGSWRTAAMFADPRLAAWIVLAIALAGLFAPLLANDRPILAPVDGRLTAPALAALPLVGALFDDPASRLLPWAPPPAWPPRVLGGGPLNAPGPPLLPG